MTSSAAKHPEIIAIRYQLNLMELARKLKTRRQQRGQPCTNNTDNIWRESRMTSSRLHGQRTFRPNLMTSVELVSLVCSTLTMHCVCVQYQQGAADFNPWVCTFGSHNCMIFEANVWTKSCSNGAPSRASWTWSMTLTQKKCRLCTCGCQLSKGNEECMHLWHRIFRHNRSAKLSTLKRGNTRNSSNRISAQSHGTS